MSQHPGVSIRLLFFKSKCRASWAYIVNIGTDPKTGKRKQKKKSGFKTKKEAEKLEHAGIVFWCYLLILASQSNPASLFISCLRTRIVLSFTCLCSHKNTIDGAHRTGRMFLKKAVEMELIKKDPTEFTYVPQKQLTIQELEGQKTIPNYLEKNELQLFLQTANAKDINFCTGSGY